MRRFKDVITVEKFNPYHDSRGRFTTSQGAASVTIVTRDPAKQHLADAARERAKGSSAGERVRGANGSYYESAAECKNHAEIREHMQDAYGLEVTVAFEGSMSLETTKEIMVGAEFVLKDFPGLGESITAVYVEDRANIDQFGRYQDFDIPYSGKRRKEIVFNTPNMENKEEIETQSRFKWWPDNSSAASISAHEFAHAASLRIYDLNKAYEYTHELNEAMKRRKEEKSIVTKSVNTIKKTPYGSGKSKSQLKKNISEYANRNDTEAIAESFADVFANGNNANPLSIEIYNVTKNTYNGLTSE